MKVIPKSFNFAQWQSNALLFFTSDSSDALSVFTHGYTTSKSDLVSWAVKSAELGANSIIFDLPGHYLGSFNEVTDFQIFQQKAHYLFHHVIQIYKNHLPRFNKLILGGHSLGALLALKALGLAEFGNLKKMGIAVGLGLQDNKGHWVSPFIENYLASRGQLVSEALRPAVLFPWLSKEKQNLQISGQHIYLLAGKDDYLVSEIGADNIKMILEKTGNTVYLERPESLGHHRPELAAGHIRRYIKKFIAES